MKTIYVCIGLTSPTKLNTWYVTEERPDMLGDYAVDSVSSRKQVADAMRGCRWLIRNGSGVRFNRAKLEALKYAAPAF